LRRCGVEHQGQKRKLASTAPPHSEHAGTVPSSSPVAADATRSRPEIPSESDKATDCYKVGFGTENATAGTEGDG